MRAAWVTTCIVKKTRHLAHSNGHMILGLAMLTCCATPGSGSMSCMEKPERSSGQKPSTTKAENPCGFSRDPEAMRSDVRTGCKLGLRVRTLRSEPSPHAGLCFAVKLAHTLPRILSIPQTTEAPTLVRLLDNRITQT